MVFYILDKEDNRIAEVEVYYSEYNSINIITKLYNIIKICDIASSISNPCRRTSFIHFVDKINSLFDYINTHTKQLVDIRHTEEEYEEIIKLIRSFLTGECSHLGLNLIND